MSHRNHRANLAGVTVIALALLAMLMPILFASNSHASNRPGVSVTSPPPCVPGQPGICQTVPPPCVYWDSDGDKCLQR